MKNKLMVFRSEMRFGETDTTEFGLKNEAKDENK
jgi:hypothetical protein